MPEGDTIHHAANRIRPVLQGQVPDAIRTPHPRHAKDRWPERLAGREVTDVTAHGKHLFLRFGDDLTIHSHLRMTGSWRVVKEGQRWHRSPRRAWLVITKDDNEVVQFDGPVLELMTETRRRFDRRLALLGPDIIKDDFDAAEVIRRMRADDPTRGLGDALLDQRLVAGIGNLWKAEGCWLAELDPWRRLKDVSDDELHRVLDELRPRMQESARDGNQTRHRKIYNNAGRACPRCANRITARGQGDDNRTTYWCPGCQT
jgi:endonuclease VIII